MNAQVRPSSSAASAPGSIYESASFTAHLKTIERKIPLHARYENFIGGKWVAPVKGGYFDNISPTTGQVICKIARSQAEDVELAIDAAHAAAEGWGRTAVAERARISTGWRTGWSSICHSSPRSRPTTTASRSAKPISPTCRWRSIISDISRAACAPRKARSASWTTTRSPTTTMSRSESSVRSSRGISPS